MPQAMPPSKIAVKLQAVSVGVADVKLARAPRRVLHVGDVGQDSPLLEFRMESINIVDDEPVGRAVVGEVPFLRVVPLKVQLDALAAYAGIFYPAGVVLTRHRDTKTRQDGHV